MLEGPEMIPSTFAINEGGVGYVEEQQVPLESQEIEHGAQSC